ncbi:PCC domain-containing protein [Nocardia sp. NBC_00511]|uniref:PCC domain-containing protein n=1 Tax=Nocardia sp. NBC_00511 TaxID=2903591 RepID=UPI0030DE629F
MHVIEIKDGELLAEITEQAAALGITNAAIVALIGAADTFTISTMPVHDAAEDIVTSYQMPAEMHGTGEIRDGKPHVHATMAVQGDRAIAGHLHQAWIGHWFARAYVIAE